MRKRETPVRSAERPAQEQPQREPGTVYISEEEIKALSARPPRTAYTEEEYQAALAANPEVHPGWKYLFTRASELAAELRRQDAETAAGGQEAEPSCLVQETLNEAI